MTLPYAVALRLWRHRRSLAVVWLALTVLAGTGLAGLSVSNRLDVWYPVDDPVLADYRAFKDRFGSDEIIVVAVEAEADFRSPTGRAEIADLIDRLYGIEGVEQVASFVTVPDELARASRRLLAPDGRAAAIIVRLAAGPTLETRRPGIVDAIAATVAEAGLSASFAGFGVIYDGLNEASTTGASGLLLAAHVIIFAVLWRVFGRLGPVLLTLAAVGSASAWTMGLYAATGTRLNMVTMALPTLVLVIGVADCVHLLRSVASQPRVAARSERLINGVAAVLGPCLLTALTTAIGFSAVALSDLPVVRGLGLFGAFGSLAAFVTATIVVTVGVSATGWLPDSRAGRGAGTLAETLVRYARTRPRIVVSVFAVLLLLAAAGMQRIETDTWSIGYLPEDHPVRRDSDRIETRFGNYAAIDYVVTAADVLEPSVLDAIVDWQDAVVRLDAIDWSWSLLDATGLSSVGARPSALDRRDLDGRFARIEVLFPELAGTLLHGREALRVSFGAPVLSARAAAELDQRIKNLAAFPAGITLRSDGYAAVYTHIIDRILDTQLAGFAAAFLLIHASLAFALGSVRPALLAIPASIVPVAVTLGAMGWTGIPLDVATVTIAGVILGLVVDDAVHLLWPHGRPAEPLGRSIARAANRSGAALVLTSFVLCSGFVVLAGAGIRSVAWFGALSAFAMLAAIVTDLLLLPALAALSGRPARARDPAVAVK